MAEIIITQSSPAPATSQHPVLKHPLPVFLISG